MIQTLSLVALGGAAGSVLRYLTVQAVGSPLGTLLVNVVGSFVIGVLFVGLAGRGAVAPLFMAGLLGGFTTFSAFSLDALRLWQAGQGGQAFLYVGASVGLSLAAVALGATLARGVWA